MIKAKFIERRNRFTALVEINGQVEAAHVANSGRLRELLRPGNEVFLVRQDKPGRVTRYDLALVRLDGCMVSVDARIPNKIVGEAIKRGELDGFKGYDLAGTEVKSGVSRLDLLLQDRQAGRYCYVEVKSVTLVEDSVARFPDAPTGRGARHLEELARLVREGHRAAVVFLVQRADALLFSPNHATDPAFGTALKKAACLGVEVYAYICRVTPEEISIIKPIAVSL